MINVVLLKSIQGLGVVGDVASVKPGYAKNWLIPFGFALFTNKKILTQMEQNKHKLELLDKENIKKASTISSICSNLQVTLIKKVFQDGRIYGSISAKEITTSLLSESKNAIKNFESGSIMNLQDDLLNYIKPSNIRISGEIKHVGEYNISIALYGNIKMDFTLIIVSD